MGKVYDWLCDSRH